MSKIFVIDDSVGACVAIERMLGSQGFDVVWETDAFTALQTVEKHSPDLVICDLVLPDISGYEVCRSLRSNPLLNSVPVVLISGDVDDDVRRRTRECDAAGIIAKPFTPALLIEKVEATLGAVSPLPDVEEVLSEVPFALQSRLTAELDAFGALDCQLVSVVDGEGRVVAAYGRASSDSLRPALKRELATLCKLVDLVSEGKDEIGEALLTLESDSGLRLVDALGGGYLLVVISASPGALGLARFLTKKAHPSLAAVLRSDLGDAQVVQ